MKNKIEIFLLSVVFAIVIFSCSESSEMVTPPENTVSKYEVKEYFKEIALGFQDGAASEVTRKWNETMRISYGGNPSTELLAELENIKNEINGLSTDGFQIEMVGNYNPSNFFIFFGSADEYTALYPNEGAFAHANLCLYWVYWYDDNNNYIHDGHIFINTTETNIVQQKYQLREMLTRSLVFGKASTKYPESIFYNGWTGITKYAEIDEELIKLLYNPQMTAGLNAAEVENVINNILGL